MGGIVFAPYRVGSIICDFNHKGRFLGKWAVENWGRDEFARGLVKASCQVFEEKLGINSLGGNIIAELYSYTKEVLNQIRANGSLELSGDLFKKSGYLVDDLAFGYYMLLAVRLGVRSRVSPEIIDSLRKAVVSALNAWCCENSSDFPEDFRPQSS